MIRVNCMFSRKVREPHRKSRIETRNVCGILIRGHKDISDGPAIRRELRRHEPPGRGWSIGGYAVVEE